MNMQTVQPCPTAGHAPALSTLLSRVRGEFQEMPGMHITLDQAMRLWAMDRETCTSVLGYLTATHFLDCDRHGKFMMTHGGY